MDLSIQASVRRDENPGGGALGGSGSEGDRLPARRAGHPRAVDHQTERLLRGELMPADHQAAVIVRGAVDVGRALVCEALPAVVGGSGRGGEGGDGKGDD